MIQRLRGEAMEGPLTSYKNTETLGKTQLDLIIMVFDGAIAAYNKAREAIESQDNQSVHDQLERARRFVVHLYTTLDTEKGGEIARQLGNLYSFVLNQTSVIEATKDLALIDDNITVLDNVRQGWIDLKAKGGDTPPMATARARERQDGGFTTSA